MTIVNSYEHDPGGCVGCRSARDLPGVEPYTHDNLFVGGRAYIGTTCLEAAGKAFGMLTADEAEQLQAEIARAQLAIDRLEASLAETEQIEAARSLQ